MTMQIPDPAADLGDLPDGQEFIHLVESDRNWAEALRDVTDLARRILRVPLAQINVQLSGTLVSVASVAQGPDWGWVDGRLPIPLEASYCKHVLEMDAPLLIRDALTDPRVKDHPATNQAGVRAYAAVPLRNREGVPLATLCVVDRTSRDWDPDDLENLRALADLLMREVQRRLRAESSLEQTEIRQQRLEEELRQSQKMEAVGRLAGGVAHDFNNFLTAIRGNTEFLLARPGLPGEIRADLQELSETAQRASDLTRHLITFSRDQVRQLRVIDLGSFTEQLVTLVQRLTGPRVRISTHFEPGLLVEADEAQLTQVVMNLAVNARDAVGGEGSIHLETREFSLTEAEARESGVLEPGRYVVLEVRDDGAGIHPEIQGRIFEPFFSTKEATRGTGLGLSICWGIVRQMEGQIHVSSEPGQGTAFTIVVPRVAPGHRAQTGPSLASQPGSPARPSRILIVEDRAEVRRVARRILERDGHTVAEAPSAERALALMEADGEGVDLLLTDMSLPGMTGHELATLLTARFPRLLTLFTSGYTQRELSDRQMDVAASFFLPKPFGPAELIDAVRSVLASGVDGGEVRKKRG